MGTPLRGLSKSNISVTNFSNLVLCERRTMRNIRKQSCSGNSTNTYARAMSLTRNIVLAARLKCNIYY